MPNQSVAPSVKAPYRLTEAEWQEISDSSVALSAVCQQMDGTGQGPGVFELLESVQRRLCRAVLLIENRVAGHGECPTCGASRTAPDAPEGVAPPAPSSLADLKASRTQGEQPEAHKRTPLASQLQVTLEEKETR